MYDDDQKQAKQMNRYASHPAINPQAHLEELSDRLVLARASDAKEEGKSYKHYLVWCRRHNRKYVTSALWNNL